jgi:hypothetical protein
VNRKKRDIEMPLKKGLMKRGNCEERYFASLKARKSMDISKQMRHISF